MTTTWQQIVDRAQIQIADSGAAVWAESVIIDWLKDAIRDYSINFPRTVSYLWAATTATEYNTEIDPGAIDIITVEHPTGDDPPTYLQRLNRTNPDFYNGDYYDYVRLGSEAEPAASIHLWLGQPENGSNIEVWATARQKTTYTTLSDSFGIPEAHHPILIQFVYWKATLELLGQEQQSPTSNSSLLMSQLNQNARDAKNRYDYMVRNALKHTGESQIIRWPMDDYDRIY